MTPEEIDALSVGELDVAVAETLGWRWVRGRHFDVSHGKHDECNFLIPPDQGIRDIPPGEWYFYPDIDADENDKILVHYMPKYHRDIEEAWKLVVILRDKWTKATQGTSALAPEFHRPFDDDVFFEELHRATDRRWPWAMLYLTPEAICRAYLKAVRNEP